jgi:hypothetical protein
VHQPKAEYCSAKEWNAPNSNDLKCGSEILIIISKGDLARELEESGSLDWFGRVCQREKHSWHQTLVDGNHGGEMAIAIHNSKSQKIVRNFILEMLPVSTRLHLWRVPFESIWNLLTLTSMREIWHTFDARELTRNSEKVEFKPD